jgi:hypothetical protein
MLLSALAAKVPENDASPNGIAGSQTILSKQISAFPAVWPSDRLITNGSLVNQDKAMTYTSQMNRSESSSQNRSIEHSRHIAQNDNLDVLLIIRTKNRSMRNAKDLVGMLQLASSGSDRMSDSSQFSQESTSSFPPFNLHFFDDSAMPKTQVFMYNIACRDYFAECNNLLSCISSVG